MNKTQLEALVASLTKEVESLKQRLAAYETPADFPATFEAIPADSRPWLNSAHGKRASQPGPVETRALEAAFALTGSRCNVGGSTHGERERRAWQWMARNAPRYLPGYGSNTNQTANAPVARPVRNL